MIHASRIRHWLPLLPLLGLLAVTYWLNEQVQPEKILSDRHAEHFPDAIMESFSAIALDERGKPRGIMAGQKLLHYSDDDSTEVIAPHVTSLSVDHPPVHITAQHASISSKGDEIFFDRAVRVLRVANAQRVALTMDTESLRVIPDKDWCETDRPVRIVEGQNILTAVGMEMDNQTRLIKLRAQVKSDYVQPQ
ncbi:MAG: LPS export ABC transporter periplasmic protein LptC [Gallionella sp.]|nr:LPS export ABC transporter periplasmic protein LptC [Gallionella sp.]MDD4959965.1 LPS export ABC transporter periplasmic protein LptC [Gallionella sp.]